MHTDFKIRQRFFVQRNKKGVKGCFILKDADLKKVCSTQRESGVLKIPTDQPKVYDEPTTVVVLVAVPAITADDVDFLQGLISWLNSTTLGNFFFFYTENIQYAQVIIEEFSPDIAVTAYPLPIRVYDEWTDIVHDIDRADAFVDRYLCEYAKEMDIYFRLHARVGLVIPTALSSQYVKVFPMDNEAVSGIDIFNEIIARGLKAKFVEKLATKGKTIFIVDI